ncbi:hypothetical protein EXIGLDRAFT_777185 [Exidia glandulosa HHB12029]|uniref:Major facilitator superfamily (MFS) profile domain-containing protein n=1 Tax=Exidia glandulosa HHB12029 TaxID=1314781 RepID=A0A165D4Z2_EXIGL|nr:hypothetical protein EXIGLDRAFT_777185 [Exidia glandulosa HHB12029]
MGYWLSTVGVMRALHLLVVLPIVIKLFKPRPEPIQLDGEENDLLTVPRPSTSRATSASSLFRRPRMAHPGSFDLVLARGSLVIDILSYVGTLFAMDGAQFTAATIVGAFGGGLSPAIHSLALLLFGTEETGKLFGALSVVQTLCSQVIGPSLFGVVFMTTVSWFPKGIFVVAILGLTMSLGFMMLIRLPPVPMEHPPRDREATLVADEGSRRASKAPAVVISEA